MTRFFSGCGVGVLTGYLLGLVMPIKVVIFAGLGLLILVLLLFFLFHLGVQDFQGY